MYVGQSERNIATCFREAEARKAFLIFDEADSLLAARSGARQSYEVRMVNEVLTWLERHRYPVSCSTNHVESLDPAAARRFLFKVSFRPMTPLQARAMFHSAFGMDAPTALDDLDQLTLGDFAVVVRKAQVLAERDPNVLVGALAAEIAAKPDVVRLRPIGFRVAISTGRSDIHSLPPGSRNFTTSARTSRRRKGLNRPGFAGGRLV